MFSLRFVRPFRGFMRSQSTVAQNCQLSNEPKTHKFKLSKAVLDENYLLDIKNAESINENSKLRKGVGDIYLIHDIKNQLKSENLSPDDRKTLSEKLQEELKRIPNDTSPDVRNYGEEPKVIAYYNKMPDKENTVLDFGKIGENLNILRTNQISNFTGRRSYFLMNDLAELEQALIKYTTLELLKHGFSIVTVPDLLPEEVINSCGMSTDKRAQVFRILPSNLCLSGTSEMALAGYFAGSKLKPDQLPVKVTAVSRCFRAETSKLQEERGIYRVHQFTKVEMFSVCRPSESHAMLEEFREIETNLFLNLGLHFKLLDMPPHELGAPAYRKYDIEAWMPGRKHWGEISSCSNCTDYQARRLNIKVDDTDEFAHTVNGTACAIPRMLIAIVETFQHKDGYIEIPKVLQKFMKTEKIVKQKVLPEVKLVKNIRK